MRLFIGIHPSKEITEYIYDTEKKLISKGILGNYTKKENIHLTLKFLGETEEKKIKDLKNVLNQYKNLNLNLKLSKISYFKRREEGLLWIGLCGDIQKIENHANQLNDQLYSFGFQKENKKFKPHITIARKVNLTPYNLKIIEDMPIENLSFKVKEIALIESNLTRQGPIYKTLY